MYIKECKWCKKIIEVEKQCLFALHISNCDSNLNKIKRIEKYKELYSGKLLVKRKILKQNCPKCNKEFEIEITESEFKRNKYRKFCSRKCANSKDWSDEQKKKISESCKKSEKVKIANSINTDKRLNHRKKNFNKSRGKKNVTFICQYCGEIGIDNHYNKNRKYHSNCSKKVSGGIRNGSSRGKHGWYKGYWCDSSYELAFLIYCLEHNINIERNYKGYKYVFNDKEHTYYPDFRVNGILTEIKNFKSELTDIKIKSVDEKIVIIDNNNINPYLEYVIEKYGNNFVKLYEK